MDAPKSRSLWQKARRLTTNAPPLQNVTKPAVLNANRELDNRSLNSKQEITQLRDDKTAQQKTMNPATIGGINKLPEDEKQAIYARYIPKELIEKFKLPALANH